MIEKEIINIALQTESQIPVDAEVADYSFILNASLDGSEPYWNTPEPGLELVGSFFNSFPALESFPIPDGNLHSIVSGPEGAAVIYSFTIPDSLSGDYYIEYSHTIYSASSSIPEIQADIITPNFLNPDYPLADTQRVVFNPRLSAEDTSIFWKRLGTFTINGNGRTKIILKQQPEHMPLRADLIKLTLAAASPAFTLNLDSPEINFDSVSVYESIRSQTDSYKYQLQINSTGGVPLRIDSIYFSSGQAFKLNGEFEFPVFVSVDEMIECEILFLPDEDKHYSDTLFIKSNAKNDPLKLIYLYGVGSNNITGMNEPGNIPQQYSLEQNYPNPFNPETQINFSLPQSGFVELKIYDLLGSEVATLLNQEYKAGTYSVDWNGKNQYEEQVSSGIYIYKITAGNFVKTRKMLLLK